MYYLTVEHDFASAHRLQIAGHKCESLHGHNWRILVTVKGATLDSRGMLIDFSDLKAIVRDQVDQFDHCYLNDKPPFDKVNPTTENLCKFFSDSISAKLPSGLLIHSIVIYESEGKSGAYFSD